MTHRHSELQQTSYGDRCIDERLICRRDLISGSVTAISKLCLDEDSEGFDLGATMLEVNSMPYIVIQFFPIRNFCVIPNFLLQCTEKKVIILSQKHEI